MPVEHGFMQSRDAKNVSAIEDLDVRMQMMNASSNQWNRQLMQPDTSIGCPNGYQKDRKPNGLRGFSSSRETERTVPKRTGA
jgi:hypothetical protein